MKLVLLPGLDGTGRLFEPFLRELDRSIEPIVISYPSDESLDYNELVDLVASQLPDSENFVLLGESFSGRVAFELGMRDIPNLVGIVFVCSFLESPHSRLGRIARAVPARTLINVGLPAFLVRKLLLGAGATDDLIVSFWHAVRSVDHKALQHRIRMVLTPGNYTGILKKPAALITAAGDCLVPKRSTQDLAEHCRESVEYEIRGPHFLLQAQPKHCAKLVGAELERMYSEIENDE